MVDESWAPYDAVALARPLPTGGEAVSALVGRGVPADCSRVFVRDSARELEVRELPQGAGRELVLAGAGEWCGLESGVLVPEGA